MFDEMRQRNMTAVIMVFVFFYLDMKVFSGENEMEDVVSCLEFH